MKLHVVITRVSGRYPRGGVLRSENIDATVTLADTRLCIRLDDQHAPEFWMEIDADIVIDDSAIPQTDSRMSSL